MKNNKLYYKLVLGILIILLLILSIFYFTFYYKDNSKDYSSVLIEIEKGNEYITQNGVSDSCFPYRYYRRGCYYEGKLKFNNGLGV